MPQNKKPPPAGASQPRRAKRISPIARIDKSKPRSQKVKSVNLALQGGGAHGAFTWGVLDGLLEDGRLEFDGISGTSAGAMNAAIVAQGHAEGGVAGARAALEGFWRSISELGRNSPMQRTFFDRLSGGWSMDLSPIYMMFDMLTRVMSPYQLNPNNTHPLRSLLEQQIHFETLRTTSKIKIYVSATNVGNGKVRVFGRDELTVDALLASACLPTMFQAIEIDGEHFWDGGYMGNPALFPLIYNCTSDDIIIVQINPMKQAEPPRTANEILNRINEISFNATLNREVRAIAFVRKLIDDENLDAKKYRRLNLHMIESEDRMSGLGVSSKLNVEWDFLMYLKEVGRDAAAQWLAAHFDQIGVATTLDIKEKFL